MKNILITGAAGFIGFHLAKFLKKRGDFVLGVDNFNTYYDLNLKINRERILKDLDVSIIKADIRDKDLIKQLIIDNNITHVVHLAAQAGVRHSFANPDDYVGSNLEGFVSILEIIKKFKGIKLVFASSSSVYGINDKIPYSVEDKTDLPTNLYGATKKANELLAYSYHHLYKIPMVGLRFFTVYGPWGRPDMAYYKFTKSILDNKSIDIYNNGNMKRDFTYIDDIINGTASAIDIDFDFEIFNLGNNKPVDLLKFVSIIEEKLDLTAIKNLKDMQQGEMINTYADITKSQNYLNYKPSISIEEGLGRFIDWYKTYQTY